MTIQKSTNFKFSDLNTNITGNSSSSQVSLSTITSSNVYTLYAGIYPANNRSKISMTNLFGAYSNTLQTTIRSSGPLSSFGTNIVSSNDANTVVVSTADVGHNTGFATVYSNTGSAYVVDTAYLQGSGANTYAIQGYGLAISGDGTTIALGAPYDQLNGTGCTFIFTKVNNVWTQQGSKIVPPIFGGGANSGRSVALSSNGNTLAIGTPGQYNGNTYIYTRSSNTWSLQSNLIPSNGIGGSKFGDSVALSDDGNTCAVGGDADNSNIGAVWIFTRSGSTWTQQAKLVPSDYILAGFYVGFGGAISLSPDGNTLVASGPLDNLQTGATWVFTRSGTTWTQQVKLVPSDAVGYSGFGSSVSIKPNGSNYTLAIGGSNDNVIAGEYGTGAGWIYVGSGSSWTKATKNTPYSYSQGFIGQIFGSSVCVAGTGNTAFISGPADYNGIGSFYVYRQAGSLLFWVPFQNFIQPPLIPDLGQQQMCYSTKFSADGNTLAIGAPNYTSNVYPSMNSGAVYIYINTGGNWSQQSILVGNTIVGNSSTSSINQGSALALSADGNTCAIGGQGDNSLTGATWVFTRSGSTWTQQAKLIGTGYIGTTIEQGFAVALSADGNTLATSSYSDNNQIGTVWVFTRSGSTWTQQQKLVPTGGIGAVLDFGYSLALSADGNTLAAGGYGDNSTIGATWIFTRSGTTWSQQQKLIGTGVLGTLCSQGISVSLSADGNTCAVGGYYDNAGRGATWVFTRSGSTWTQQAKLIGTGAISSAPGQGFVVALSADGNSLVIGPIYQNAGVWFWTRSAGTWTQQNYMPPINTSTLFVNKSVNINASGKTIVGGYLLGGGNSDPGTVYIYQ